MSTALAIRDDQDQFDDTQRAALATLGVDVDCPPAMLQVYLNYAQRTKLDPFQRQIYLIGRKDGQASKRAGHDVLKYTIQTGIDGFRVIARRAADRAGIGYSEEAVQWCGQDEVWRDVWLKAEPPAAARVIIRRGDGERFTGLATWQEYAETEWGEPTKPKGMWKSRGPGQLIKCAEALALRKAFPNDLGGMYTDDEMGRASSESTTKVEQVPQTAKRAQGLRERAATKAEIAPLSDDAAQMIEMIATTDDLDTLRGWYKEWSEQEVRDAIKVRVEFIRQQQLGEPVDAEVVA
jgi:phage recombination protein Bet